MSRPARTSARLLVAFCSLTISAAVRADDVYKFGRNNEPQLQPLYVDVTILRVDDDKLLVRTRNGGDVPVPLASVIYVNVSNDGVLSGADQAFATREWDKAVDGYAKIVAGADASWKVRYAAPRMLIAADKSKRVDAAIAAWIALARVDAKRVAAVKPALPPKGSRYLDDAAKSLEAAARTATTDAQRQVFLAFLLDVQQARGDAAAIATATDQLAASTGAPGADPAATAVPVETRLAQARAAMQLKRYDNAIATITSAAPLIVEPGQQAEAMSIVADARAAVADALGDGAARRDAAIAYLRIVAHLAGEPAAAGFVPRSLLAAARLQADAGDVAAARALYDQVRGEYPGSPAAAQATALAARLPAGE